MKGDLASNDVLILSVLIKTDLLKVLWRGYHIHTHTNLYDFVEILTQDILIGIVICTTEFS